MTHITAIDKVNEYHRSPIIIHDGWKWYIAEFENPEQLDFFADTLGFSYKLEEEKATVSGEGVFRRYSVDREIKNASRGFWKRDDVPDEAKPIKALSNGLIVTCYFVNDGETITIYRPNPNAKEVYKPLSLEQQIAHHKIYGLY